jgi:hypothetical protein
MFHALRRAPRLWLGPAVALAAVAAALTLRAGGAGAADPPSVSSDELALRQDMRKLWEQHVAWTRLAIVSFAHDLPDLAVTERRLLQNQGDIGRAFGSFYGARNGRMLGGLLHEHILQAVDVLAAAKAGDGAALARALDAWYANAYRIAALLNRLNPESWPLDEMRDMMHRHLKLTTDEAVARLQGDYARDVALYDRVEDEILQMADVLSDGIVAQFPDRF